MEYEASFELKEGMKTYDNRPFLLPKSQKETTMKELNRLSDLEVLEFHPTLE